MIEFSRLTVLIITELLIGLSLISVLLIGFYLLKKRQIQQAAEKLVERIRRDMAPRSDRLRQKLSNSYCYSGELLEQSLHDLNHAEKRLYQNLINGYLKQDVAAFQQIDVDVENLVLAYQELEPPSVEMETLTEEKSDEDDEVEIGTLQEENQRLSEELKVAMNTLARMLSEYTSMVSAETNQQKGAKSSHPQSDFLDVEATQQAQPEWDAESLSATNDQIPTESDLDFDAEESQGFDRTLADQSEAEVSTGPVEQTEDQVLEEVLEVEDELSDWMGDEVGETSGSEPKPPPDSLTDELEQVDILTPNFDEAENVDAQIGCLEEEWAKLLEEDAKSADVQNKQA